MSHEIRAIVENGLLRPLDPISLPEQGIVSIVISTAAVKPFMVADDVLQDQRAALREMFEEAERLPLERPDDGFSGAAHDEVLYGWKE
jgi:predicted DNA-binding antitoxin AbrB/MazE fold protein